MKIRLSYKIFGAFLLTSLTVAGLTIGTLHFFGRRLFVDYIHKMEAQRLADLSQMLTAEYAASGNWSNIRDNPTLWYRLVHAAGRRDSEPPPPPPDSLRQAPPDAGAARSGRRMPPPIFHRDSRIFLLDAHKHLVAGQVRDLQSARVQKILQDGKLIGWLGVNKRRHRLSPLERAFLQQQSKLFYLIGAGIFALTVFVSLFLSRHLLAPIKELTDGTRALASRQFATRIAARTGDELGQLAADFNVMAETLEHYEEMRKQWISDISHELRTPLSILRGEIEAIQDGVRRVDSQTLDSLYAEVRHLGKIVDDLHELSMADSGALHLDRRPLDVVQVVTDTVELFRTRFQQAGIAIAEQLPSDREIILLGDANRLAQLFTNLLENTLRYTDAPGELKIAQHTAGDRLTLTFEDSGPGVPEDALERLFDRLYRVDSARTRSQGGSGLGLAICKAIVESHGGTIAAANAPGSGLKIEIRLPLIASL